MKLLKRSVFIFFIIGLFILLGGCGKVVFKFTLPQNTKEGDLTEVDITIENANSSDIVWTSSDEEVAYVKDGKLYAVGGGSALITGVVDGVRYAQNVEITAKERYSIGLYVGGKVTEHLEVSEDNPTITLPTPTLSGYEFGGWFISGKCTGDPITTIDLSVGKDMTIYSKWILKEYPISFVLNGGTCEGLPTTRSSLDTITLPTPTISGFTFLGWYDNPKFEGDAISVLDENNTNITTLYAKWNKFDVYLEMNGGNLYYESRDALVADLLADYNKAVGKSYTLDNLPTGAWEAINFSTFFFKGANKTKWAWLASYLADVAGSTNVAGCKALLTYTNESDFKKANSNYTYEVSYEFRGFMLGVKLTSNANYPSADYSNYEIANGFWDKLNEYKGGSMMNNTSEVTLPTPKRESYNFVGWYDNPDLSGEAITKVNVDATVYAKWEEKTPVEAVVISNKVEIGNRYQTYQLQWNVLPAEAAIQSVKFSSSNEAIATVDTKGLVTFKTNGIVTITVTSTAPTKKFDSVTFNVSSPDHFELSYESNSYMQVSETIKLNAEYIKRDGSKAVLVWESLNPNIATVDNGVVTGVAEGVAKIKVSLKDNASISKEFSVTVISDTLSEALDFILSQHESNIHTTFDIGIGAGTPVYYMDILGSVNHILFNDKLTIKTDYEAAQKANTSNYGSSTFGNTKSSTEFICVHYTGNMSETADAAANASYFAGTDGSSIHYTTGNDGVYSVLDDKLVGWHAGDGTSVKFEWIKTGVMHEETDPTWPVWGISANSKFTINGKETSVAVPTGTTSATSKVTDAKWINKMGLSFTIIDGEYYMGTTWWCYSQISEGRICSKGGNLNSIGIESCVNEGSDLWYTWQKTAQLVAKLMLDNNLDITRVVGHHFFTAKDCPQPLLENNCELWHEFIELVQAEYEVLTTYKDYKIEMSIVDGASVLSDTGRISKMHTDSEIVTYKVKITKGNVSEEITLSTSVASLYGK